MRGESTSQPLAVKSDLATKVYEPMRLQARNAKDCIEEDVVDAALRCASVASPFEVPPAALRRRLRRRRRPAPTTQDQSDGGNASPLWSNNRPQEIPAEQARRAKQ